MRRRKKRSRGEPNPRNIPDVISLTSLREGEIGVLAYSIGGLGLVRRLAEMGLTPGVKVEILRKGPLHGPLEIQVRGVSLALGRGVASRVFVKRLRIESNG